MDIADFVTFTLPGVQHGDKLTKQELKALAGRMQAAMNVRGFECGEASDLFGSSTDTWGFSIVMEEAGFAVSMDAAPDQRDPAPDHWLSMISTELGNGRTARAEGIAAVARIECAVQRMLVDDLEATDVDWHPRYGEGKVDAYFSFLLSGSGGAREADVEALAGMFKKALQPCGLAIGEAFGTSRDFRGFVVRAPAAKILVGVTPDVTTGLGPLGEAPTDRWSVLVYLDSAGWFQRTRDRRNADFEAVQKSVRKALVTLGARDLSRLPWMGDTPWRVPKPLE